MSVATTNLISASRLRARKSRARVALWLWTAPVCCGLLGGAYLVQRFAGTPNVEAAAAAIEEVRADIKETDRRVAGQKAEIREADAQIRANRAVGEQPNWSVLLELLAATLGDEAALTSLTLEPVAPPAVPGGKGPAAEQKSAGRPEHLRLKIVGVARSQEAASKFVLALEGTPTFDRVQLVETKRTGETEGERMISFQVSCDLTDPSANGGATASAGERK